MIFLLKRIKLVQIRDENGHGDKMRKEISLLGHFNLVNQTINRTTECPEYVPEMCPEFAPKRFYVSLSVSI